MDNRALTKWMTRLVVVIVLVLLVYHMPRTYEIDEVLEATQRSLDNPEAASTVQVTIQGIYSTHWFADDTFEGNIQLDTYPIIGGTPDTITFYSAQGGYGSLDYRSSESTIDFLGYLKMSPGAASFILCVFEETDDSESKKWSTIDGTIIVYPNRPLDELRDQLYTGSP